jgi:hypothetical protein
LNNFDFNLLTLLLGTSKQICARPFAPITIRHAILDFHLGLPLQTNSPETALSLFFVGSLLQAPNRLTVLGASLGEINQILDFNLFVFARLSRFESECTVGVGAYGMWEICSALPILTYLTHFIAN